MADVNQKKIELDQATLDRAHARLDNLIGTTERARVQACNEGKTSARDTLEKVGAYLRLARAEAGAIDLGKGIMPRSGNK